MEPQNAPMEWVCFLKHRLGVTPEEFSSCSHHVRSCGLTFFLRTRKSLRYQRCDSCTFEEIYAARINTLIRTCPGCYRVEALTGGVWQELSLFTFFEEMEFLCHECRAYAPQSTLEKALKEKLCCNSRHLYR